MTVAVDETDGKKPPTRKPTARGLKGKTGGEALTELHAQNRREKRIVNQKHNWDYLRETFISADPPISLKKLAEDHDINYSYMRQRASEERWNYLRVEEQRRLFKQKREQHARSVLEKALKFDEASIATATLGQTLVMARLSEIAAQHKVASPVFQAALQQMAAGVPVPKEALYSSIRFTELKELALAAKLYQDMGRLAFGTEDATRQIEETSNDGGGVENVISVSQELGKDDPNRLAAMLEAFERAGLVNILMNMDDGNDDETIDGEVVEAPTDEVKELTAQ